MIQIKECKSLVEFKDAYPLFSQLGDNLSLEEFLERLNKAKKQGYQLFRGCLDEQLVGLIGFREQDDLSSGHYLYVDDLIVGETARGQGVGEKLMRFAEEVSQRRDCQYIRLNCGLERVRSHHFYERLGYCKTAFAYRLVSHKS